MSDLIPEHEEKIQQLTDQFQAMKTALKQFWKCMDTPEEHTAEETKASAIALVSAFNTWANYPGGHYIIHDVIQVLGNPEAWDD